MKRRAVITGGAKRLGRAMALELASQGIDIVIHFNNSSEEAEETRDIARKYGVNAELLKADLLEMDETKGLVKKARTLIGAPIDILINNASIFEYDNLKSADLTSWNRHLDSNLRSAVFLTQEFSEQAPKMTNKNNELPFTTSNVINIIDPDVVILGGGLSNIGFLYDEGVSSIYSNIFSNKKDTPILSNKLGDSAGVFGAALLN